MSEAEMALPLPEEEFIQGAAASEPGLLALPEEAHLDDSDALEDPYEDPYWEENPDLWIYRERTIRLLRRYLRYSVEVGRLPSLLGREIFQTRITRYKAATFEDTVIFVHDVERELDRLDGLERDLIARMVMQDYTQDEVAEQTGCWRRTVGRKFREALDRLSVGFLRGGLLTPLPGAILDLGKSCQEAKIDDFFVSGSV